MATFRQVIAVAPKHSYTSSICGSVYLYEREDTYVVIYNTEIYEYGRYLVSFTNDFGEAAHAYQAVMKQIKQLTEMVTSLTVSYRKEIVSGMNNWLIHGNEDNMSPRTSDNVDTFAADIIKKLSEFSGEVADNGK